jgi:hypothetical protein
MEAAYDLGDRTRLCCMYCLRTFDPYEPLPIPKKSDASDAAGGLDALVGEHDDQEPPDLALDVDGDDEKVEPDIDFEEGV